MAKVQTAFEQIASAFGNAFDVCMTLCDGGVVSVCQVCGPIMALKVITEYSTFEFTKAIDLSEHLYTEIVDKQDDDAAEEQVSAIYQNVITIHGNIISTHNMLSQVLTVVSGIDKKVTNPLRRMQVNDCISTKLGYVHNCSKPSCESPTRLCDGSFNYEYISQLEGGENHN